MGYGWWAGSHMILSDVVPASSKMVTRHQNHSWVLLRSLIRSQDTGDQILFQTLSGARQFSYIICKSALETTMNKFFCISPRVLKNQNFAKKPHRKRKRPYISLLQFLTYDGLTQIALCAIKIKLKRAEGSSCCWNRNCFASDKRVQMHRTSKLKREPLPDTFSWHPLRAHRKLIGRVMRRAWS